MTLLFFSKQKSQNCKKRTFGPSKQHDEKILEITFSPLRESLKSTRIYYLERKKISYQFCCSFFHSLKLLSDDVVKWLDGHFGLKMFGPQCCAALLVFALLYTDWLTDHQRPFKECTPVSFKGELHSTISQGNWPSLYNDADCWPPKSMSNHPLKTHST